MTKKNVARSVIVGWVANFNPAKRWHTMNRDQRALTPSHRAGRAGRERNISCRASLEVPGISSDEGVVHLQTAITSAIFLDCKHTQSFFRCVLWRIVGTIRSSSTSLKVPSTHTFGGTSTCPTVQPPFQKQNICAIMMPVSSAP